MGETSLVVYTNIGQRTLPVQFYFFKLGLKLELKNIIR
jgi:hypothetical protein